MFKSKTDDDRFKLVKLNQRQTPGNKFYTGEDTGEHEKTLVFNDLATRTGPSNWLFIAAAQVQWQLMVLSSHIST